MKNFIHFIKPEEIFNYIGNLWRSDSFKESHHNPDGYIHQIIKEFSKTPRIFFDMHEETMEMVHFSSWFHAIQHRYYYTNDILHDLYYHHEFFHLISMTYRNDYSFIDWKKKMDSNEFWASLESEVLIYFYMPELRNLSFKNEIWVDRFLNDKYYADLKGKYYHYSNDLSNKLKARIAFFRDECQFNPRDEIEKQISDYTISSNEWANIWCEDNAWMNVESEMTLYLNLLQKNPEEAIKHHLYWLKDLQEKDPYNVAFGKQARNYSAVHRRLFQSSYNPKN